MNKQQNDLYLKIPLIVSLIALVAAVGLLLVKGTMALNMFTPENPETINLALSISAALAVIGVAVYAMLAPDAVRNFLSGRQARYGSNALVMILAFAGIILAANYLAIKNPKTLVDMTEDKQNTLSPEMVSALENLPEKINATAFYTAQMPRDTALQLLENMKANSKGNFDYRFVDPDSAPLEAKNAGVTGDGKIVLEMGGRKEIAVYADQTEMLRAMSRLLNPEERTVYFLAGHGEHDINGTDQNAISRARETLESKNYTVKTLNLLADNRIPEDARVVIVAGPLQPLTASEVGLLNAYTRRGGAVVIMEDPLPFTDFGEQADPLAESLERIWGIRLRNDFVVDTASTTIQNAIGANYANHPVTRAMTLFTIFPLARSLEFSTQPEGITQTPLVQTSPEAQSWGETDFTPLQGENTTSVQLDPETDTPGPVILVAAGENIQTGGRVVVIGNSLFITDEGFDAYGNGDLFVSAVDWAAGDDNPVDITIHEATQRTFMPPGQLQWLAILLGSVCILPGLVLAAGVAAWLSRRRRG